MRKIVNIFNIDFDAITMSQAIQDILTWSYHDDYACRYIVTPNVDHVVKLQNNQKFYDSYMNADMIVVDGKPVRLASILLRKPLPETIPGSDLCPTIFEHACKKKSISIFLLGAKEGVAVDAAHNIKKRWPCIEICGTYSPKMGFNTESDENSKVLDMINAAKPDILVIGLGAPKQEIWINENRDHIQAKVALCVGATIDFLAGNKKRAPLLIRKLGLEWLHRALSEPRRLLGRYIKDALIFPVIFIKELTKK